LENVLWGTLGNGGGSIREERIGGIISSQPSTARGGKKAFVEKREKKKNSLSKTGMLINEEIK